ncbi:hypothetical protein GQ53DRAFT_849338 [Thozetella sp. PMI_491]|nr:hypothetical protein GQ53DRAFT_849338 [Thozetella sp. PMI_491]
METISRAIWGTNESREEPMSGVTGDVSKGEPYDAGNIGEHIEHRDEPATSGNPVSHNESEPTNAAKMKDSSRDAGDHSQAQNDTRDPADPNTNPASKNTQAKENVDDSAGVDENNNPVKVDGPGPQPIAEVAKHYGGDAGNAPSSDSVDKESGAAKQQENPTEEEDGPQKTSHGEGTGEQWVKSSGLKADGGDFDAAAPGAGREADRLLEEKGMRREENGLAGSSTDTVESKGSSGSGKTKVSLKDKIKAKLHKS